MRDLLRIDHALEELGDREDLVAKTLLVNGVHGIATNMHSCPVSQYLHQMAVPRDIEISTCIMNYTTAQNVLATRNVVIVGKPPQFPELDLGNVTDLPTSVTLFVSAFDRHEHPELEVE